MLRIAFLSVFLVSGLLHGLSGFSQARLILNNGPFVVMNGGTSATPIYIVLANGNSNAITRNTSGHIVSEGEYNLLRWNIGTNTGTYEIPYGRASSITDTVWVRFNISTAGVGGEGFDFSTYRTATWDNNAYRPSPVTHVYLDGTTTNNSDRVVDRFYQISTNGRGYTTQPTINTLVLSYLDVEHTASGNTITEANLGAQYWKESAPIGWHTNTTLGTVNTSSNRVGVASSVPSLTDVRWWTLTDKTYPLPVLLVDFKAFCANQKINIKFTTATEINNSHFELIFKNDEEEWLITKINGAGFSTVNQNYQYVHSSNLPDGGQLYLNQIDFDGTKTTYGPFTYKNCSETSDINASTISIFPNPASDNVNIKFNSNLNENFNITVYNAIGQQLQQQFFSYTPEGPQTVSLKTQDFSHGVYFVSVVGDQGTSETLKFRKVNP